MSDSVFLAFINSPGMIPDETDVEWALRVLRFVLNAQDDKRYDIVRSFKTWYNGFTCLSEIYKSYEQIILTQLSHTIPGEVTYQ